MLKVQEDEAKMKINKKRYVGRLSSSEEKVVLEFLWLKVKRYLYIFLCYVTLLCTLTYVIARVFSNNYIIK